MAEKKLFGSVKDKKLQAKYVEALKYIVTSTATAAGYGAIPNDFATAMLKLEPGLFTVLTPADPMGNVQVKATDAGIEASTGKAPEGATEPTSAFAVEDGLPIPAGGKRVGGGTPGAEKYPFSKMAAVGSSFFVPATEAVPNPFKSLGSTVNGANRRFKKAGQPNHFVIRKRNAGDPLNPADPNSKKEAANGARVYRDK